MILRILLALLALPVVLVLLLVAGVFLIFLPPVVSWVSLGMLCVVALWLLLRRRSGRVTGSEFALMGSHSSKDGLL